MQRLRQLPPRKSRRLRVPSCRLSSLPSPPSLSRRSTTPTPPHCPANWPQLIVDARTTSTDPATLLSGTNGASDLFSLFVGATLPTPTDQTCDNSAGIPPGVTVTGLTFAPGSFPACLNPTAIPPATSTDPQFAVQAKGGVLSSTTSSITWKDAASATHHDGAAERELVRCPAERVERRGADT